METRVDHWPYEPLGDTNLQKYQKRLILIWYEFMDKQIPPAQSFYGRGRGEGGSEPP